MESKRINVLITGATGFLGGALARRLHQEGYHVLATGRNKEKGAELQRIGIRFVSADLTNSKQVEELCAGQDWIIHSAAKSSVWGSREEFWKSNVLGTQILVQSALRHSISRFVHVSSPSIYFEFEDKENIREEDPLPKKFVNSYTASKYAAEEEILVGVQKGLPAIILRPRAIFGPGDTAIFPRIVRNLERGKLPIIGSGTNKIDISYIDNVVEACICAAKANTTQTGRAYNISDGQPVYLWELLASIAKELNYPLPRKKRPLWLMRRIARAMEITHRLVLPHKEPILTEYGIGLLALSCTLNIERAKSELGYEPIVTTPEGIAHFIEWWKAQNA